MNKPLMAGVRIGASCILGLALSTAGATELVYTPINPSFGGNPGNGPNLLAVAQAQNSTSAPKPSKLETFNNNLQQAILSRLSAQAINTMFGSSNKLSPGTYDTAGYTIQVIDLGNGTLQIQTTDKSNGATTTFEVSPSL